MPPSSSSSAAAASKEDQSSSHEEDDHAISDSEEEDVDEEDPLAELVERLGFPIAQASAALLECQGNVEQAKQQLLDVAKSKADASAEATAIEGRPDHKKQASSKKKKGKGKNKNSNNNAAAAAAAAASSNDGNDDDDDDDSTTEKQQQPPQSTTSTRNKKKNTKNKSFKEQRKADLRFQKALRDKKRVCRVCGGPHARKDCPGIADDGRGHSRHYDTKSRKKEKSQRKYFQEQKQKDYEFLQIGTWTTDMAYYDGYADLVQTYYSRNHDETTTTTNTDDNASSSTTSQEVGSGDGLVQWIVDWASLDNVRLGEDPIHNLTPEQRKLELKTWAGSRLQKTARALLASSSASASTTRQGENKNAGSIVDAALQDRNPRAALIQIIMDAHSDNADNNNSNNQEGGATPERTLQSEWPGYRGCVCPFSVLDTHAMAALDQLQQKSTTRQQNKPVTGVKAILSIPPTDVAKWMAVHQEEDEGESLSSSSFLPIDLSQLVKNSLDMAKTKAAASQLVVAAAASNASGKEGRASADAELVRLRKTLAGKLARKVNDAELLHEASKARLHPGVLESLKEGSNRYIHSPTTTTATKTTDPSKNRVVVGISCGLNYDTAEACHPVLGEAVRAAQKEACKYAIQVAVKYGLSIVLECQDAKECSQLEDTKDVSCATPIPLASSDLIRILVETAPPDTTMLLRNGSLSTASKPGIHKVMETWPHLHLALSASLAYAKCPKELINTVFDVPLTRFVLTSESPHCVPPLLSGSHLVHDCLPPHAACIAETVATIKGGSCSRQEVLRQCCETTRRLFGFDMDEEE